MTMLLLAVVALALVGYLGLTRPCRSGHHWHRHLRHHHYRWR
jgi:hypothetical protein